MNSQNSVSSYTKGKGNTSHKVAAAAGTKENNGLENAYTLQGTNHTNPGGIATCHTSAKIVFDKL